MNIIQIAGRLGSDPEMRYTAGGQKVWNLRVATNVRKGGKDETVWWRVTIWGDKFDKMLSYLKKGSAVIIVGEMGKPEIYTDREGRPQVSLEITAEIVRFSPFGSSRDGQSGEQQQQQTAQPANNFNSYSQPAPSGFPQGDTPFASPGGYSGFPSPKQEEAFEEEEMPF